MPARSSAALIAMPPRSMAVSPANAPESLPIGVPAVPTITEPGIGGLLEPTNEGASVGRSPVFSLLAVRITTVTGHERDRCDSYGHSRGRTGRGDRGVAAAGGGARRTGEGRRGRHV